MKKVFLLFCLLSLPAHAFSLYDNDSLSLGLKGYYKNLFVTSKRAATGNWYWGDINRLRTEWDTRFFKNFSTKLIWDNEVIGGGYVNTEEFAQRQTQRNEPYLNLDYEISRKKNFFYGQQFYRAYAKLETEPVTLTVGRQKVDWGVMRLVSPADLFTPLALFGVEPEERVGVDAINLSWAITPTLKLNPAYTLNSNFDRSRTGARLTKTVGHFDLSLLGGRFLKDTVVGADISGDIGNAGIRGEFLYDRAAIENHFIQLALGADYGFQNGLTVALEYFMNGQFFLSNPATDPVTGNIVFRETANQIKTVKTQFISLQAKYDLTPLWVLRMENIVDLEGASTFLRPETKYSLFSWMDFSVGALLPFGKTGGEFSAIPKLYYAQVQLFF
ncbi:MAG: hypothetical protein HYS22_05375 [Deltaproteobacteria bacterium]|nr:hypothetical protein [Deltaproteobacteria bacterium]